MEGYGSGRRPESYVYTVEDCLFLDIITMIEGKWIKFGCNSFGMLKWTIDQKEIASVCYEACMASDPVHIRLHYTWRKTEKLDYKVFLTKTFPNYGGFRYWFICPACGKRVRKLYAPPNLGYFFCRTCQNLTYTSCRESHRYDNFYGSLATDTGLSIYAVKRVLKRLNYKVR